MTPIDQQAFKQAFNRLAVAVRLPADQTDAAQQRVYWDGLVDYPIAAVVEAAAQLAKTATWFPKLAEWRDAAAQVRNQQAITAGTRPEPAPACATCHDAGWDVRTCPDPAPCGRPSPHAGHTYVVACECRATNPVYQRHRAELRERARARHRAASTETPGIVRIP